MKNESSFYNSLSASGYLTPLQRKKLREIRNADFSPDTEPSASQWTVKKKIDKPVKVHKKILKAKQSVRNKSILAPKKKKIKGKLDTIVNGKFTPPIVQNISNELKKRKIFTARSPGHLKKAKYIMSYNCKKNLNLGLKTSFTTSLSQGKEKNLPTKTKSSQFVPADELYSIERPKFISQTSRKESSELIAPNNSNEFRRKSSRRLFNSPTKNIPTNEMAFTKSDSISRFSTSPNSQSCSSDFESEIEMVTTVQKRQIRKQTVVANEQISTIKGCTVMLSKLDIGIDIIKGVSLLNNKPSSSTLMPSLRSEDMNDFEFDWPSDSVFQERESKARAINNQNVLKAGIRKESIMILDEDKIENFRKRESVTDKSSASKDISNCIGSEDFDFDWPPDDVFLEREARARSLNKIIDWENETNTKPLAGHIINESGESYLFASKKLYPIFDCKQRKKEITPIKRPLSSSHLAKTKKIKTMKGDKNEQYIIDAGQKGIGAIICNTCGMVYTIGEECDEEIHSKYHNLYIASLKFPGWKKEKIIGDFDDGRVIMVTKEDQNFMIKKIEDVLVVVNRQLGFPTGGLPTRPNAVFLLFVSTEKRIVGCLIAESISQASRVVLDASFTNIVPCLPDDSNNNNVLRNTSAGSWCSSCDVVPAICGISRIWVAKDSRRQKVAKRMVDCLRCHFIYGCVVEMHQLAFSDPSLDGREFAAQYCGTDNFLVYK